MDAAKPADSSAQRKPRQAIPAIESIPVPVPSHPVKPPEQGLSPRALGTSDTLTGLVHVIDKSARYAPAKATAWKSADGKGGAKIKLGDKPDPQSQAPGLPFKGTGIPDPGTPAAKKTAFKDFEIEGDALFVAQAKRGDEVDTYITNDAQDAHVVKGQRAMVVSLPGRLEFGVLDPQGQPPQFKVLAQGTEELRTNPGNHLTKAVIAVPTDAMGEPVDGALIAYRTFTAKATDPDGNPLQYATEKYRVEIKDGTITTSQIDGLKAVKLAAKRKADAAADAPAAAAPAAPPAAAKPAQRPAAPAPSPSTDEPPF